jgi:hypothetical protein
MRAALRVSLLAALLGGCASIGELFLPAPAGLSRPPVVAEEEPAPAPSRSAPVAREPAPPAPPSRPAPPPATSAPPPPAAATPPPAPTPAPPRTAAIPREPSTPTPPVLAPQASAEEEQRIKSQAERRIEGTERIVQKIDPARLAREQRENYSTIQSFLAKAREALSARDVQRAFTLADKAYLLADELSKAPR